MLGRALRRFVRIPFSNITSIIAIASAIVFLAAVSTGITSKPSEVKASYTVPMNMCVYGWMNYSTEQAIINAHPEFLVGSSPAGPAGGNANISLLSAAGIKFFEYIDSGYVGYNTYAPDLGMNLSYIESAAYAGAYGIFVDQVCDGIYTTPDYYYLGQISAKAHSLGLKVVFNTGLSNWSDTLMDYCDYVNSSETWQGGALSPSQSKWASRTWLLTYNVYDAGTAAALTNSAISQGIRAHYACTTYMAPSSWFGSYVAQISSTSPVYIPPEPVPDPAAVQASITLNSNPSGVEVWLDYSYQGNTPLTINVAEGNHHIAFAHHGYLTLEGDFTADNTPFTITGDLVSGRFTSTGSEIVYSTRAPVSFASNPSGAEVWLDNVYKGETPLTISVTPVAHHIRFVGDGDVTLEGEFIADNTAFAVTGDLESGQFTSTGTEIVSSVQAPVSPSDNILSLKVWLDDLHGIFKPVISQLLDSTLTVFIKVLTF